MATSIGCQFGHHLVNNYCAPSTMLSYDNPHFQRTGIVEFGFTCNQSIMQKVFHYLYPNNIEKCLHVLVRGRILKIVTSEQLVVVKWLH